jgi:gas vesicle protein
MSDNSNNTTGVLLAFIIGGLVGAGLALLYAPASGEETRKRLREEIDKTDERLKKGYEAAMDTVEEGVGKVREIIEEKKNEVAAAYQAGKETYQRERGKHTKQTA